ncbi:hypothetical protein [Zavarzinia sp. CC-PAN008]|uniref:hypothetical protein n=1 Tax=Zavarzinia sp. CC-PAN008 TaxID=3243332 RepID=UPI003F74A002
MASSTYSSDSIRDDARRASEKANASYNDAKSALHDAADKGREMASAEYDRLRQGVDELIHLVKQAGADSTEKAREAVKARPVTSLVGAFAVGFAAAILMRR